MRSRNDTRRVRQKVTLLVWWNPNNRHWHHLLSVFCRKDPDHAWHFFGQRSIYAPDHCMAMWALKYRSMDHAWHLHVGYKSRLPRKQVLGISSLCGISNGAGCRLRWRCWCRTPVDLIRGRLDRLNHLLIAGVTREISMQPLPYFLHCGVRVTAQQFDSRHNCAGSRKPILNRKVLPQSSLNGMQFATGQTFNGGD